jgi:pyruvate,water dikinase
MGDPYILWFEEIKAEALNQVGKKGASLAEMMGLGLRVPRGFVVTLEAWDIMMRQAGLDEKISAYLKGFESQDLAKLDVAQEAGKHICQLIRSTALPHSIRKSLLENYERLCEVTGVVHVPVAIRSSGTLSRPGLFSSFLNVSGKALEKALIECWASTYSPRALAMRAQQGQSIDREPIGVVICQFIAARTAGVLFTVHPVTGNRNKWVIEASWGLGESVVQASVLPDRFTVDISRLEIEERNINAKANQVIPTPRGVSAAPVPADMQMAPSLTDEEIWALVEQAKIVQGHFGGVPQDIEWAVSSQHPLTEGIFLLQARPVVGYQDRRKSIYRSKHKSDADHISELMIDRLFG